MLSTFLVIFVPVYRLPNFSPKSAVSRFLSLVFFILFNFGGLFKFLLFPLFSAFRKNTHISRWLFFLLLILLFLFLSKCDLTIHTSGPDAILKRARFGTREREGGGVEKRSSHTRVSFLFLFLFYFQESILQEVYYTI